MPPFDDRRAINRSASPSSSVDAFDGSRRAPAPHAAGTRGRLIFALDATMSRQPTWDAAIALQGRMFDITAKLGGLDVQLVYFRGLRECKASAFVSGGAGLDRLMSRIRVEGGNTQIGRVLAHARDEARRARTGALVFVGDAVEERVDPLCSTAGELALLGLKCFMFHEGHDRAAERAFREIARVTGGAYAAFDSSAPAKLGSLLAAAAAYAAGGTLALEGQNTAADREAARLLLSQIR
ncbi:VWA domain-containing protein [Lichenibacterium dinghuense]|uniref:VWA domain-containing protein n=1 Tax=Lichenibacterium dinghuense TaxID=2895977 RepID=UPI003D17DC7B